jgi:transcriptional regulator
MYIPPHFAENRPEALFDIIASHPLGTLVTKSANGLEANHFPFELDTNTGEFGTLRTHAAKANPIWRETASNDEALVIFKGLDAYVSPNWYPSKQETHQQVPTWNYQAVHVYGKIKFTEDAGHLRVMLELLTHAHEHKVQQASPWQMADAPPDYIDAMLKAIVGIEITITKILGKSKLSQNKHVQDRTNLAAELLRHGHTAIAEATLKSILTKE